MIIITSTLQYSFVCWRQWTLPYLVCVKNSRGRKNLASWTQSRLWRDQIIWLKLLSTIHKTRKISSIKNYSFMSKVLQIHLNSKEMSETLNVFKFLTTLTHFQFLNSFILSPCEFYMDTDRQKKYWYQFLFALLM